MSSYRYGFCFSWLYVLLAFCCNVGAELSESTLNAAKGDLAGLITADDDLAAKFLRLAFHDAVGGGNDGCIDLSDPDNFGLDVPIRALDPIVSKYASTDGLSRADLWVLAAMVGCEQSQNQIDFPMQHYGRIDCETLPDCEECSATTGTQAFLPSADLTTRGLVQYFADEFGFSAQQTVAIMGAHTLGEASRMNSGFDGRNGWVDRKESLDNEYYELLVGGDSPNDSIETLVNDAPGWGMRSVDNSALTGIPNRAVWTRRARNGREPLIMLNSDVAIVRDLEGNLDSNNRTNCRFSGRRGGICPHAALTLQFAAEYTFDNELWLNDFRDALNVMTTFGYDTTAGCSGEDVCLLRIDGVEEQNSTTSSESADVSQATFNAADSSSPSLSSALTVVVSSLLCLTLLPVSC